MNLMSRLAVHLDKRLLSLPKCDNRAQHEPQHGEVQVKVFLPRRPDAPPLADPSVQQLEPGDESKTWLSERGDKP